MKMPKIEKKILCIKERNCGVRGSQDNDLVMNENITINFNENHNRNDEQ